jgi:hypothetical protein
MSKTTSWFGSWSLMAEAWIKIHDSSHTTYGGHLQPQYEATFTHPTAITIINKMK